MSENALHKEIDRLQAALREKEQEITAYAPRSGRGTRVTQVVW
jgi:hypothetical protein